MVFHLIEAKNIAFDEIQIGEKASFTVKITKEMVEIFAQLSGDFNPLHMDDTYAEKTKFGKRVCHGMLLSSLFSQLVGMFLPGKNSLYFSGKNKSELNPPWAPISKAIIFSFLFRFSIIFEKL